VGWGGGEMKHFLAVTQNALAKNSQTDAGFPLECPESETSQERG
jgi:hypothetical protein